MHLLTLRGRYWIVCIDVCVALTFVVHCNAQAFATMTSLRDLFLEQNKVSAFFLFSALCSPPPPLRAVAVVGF